MLIPNNENNSGERQYPGAGLGHSGLAMYDNTARMHDPVLIRLPRLFALTRTANRPRFYLADAHQNGPTFAKRLNELACARFTSPDPLYAKFGSISPWSHCAADPLNIIDPLGEDNWQLDDRGYFSLVETTDDEFDTILGQDGASIQVNKGFLNPIYEDINQCSHSDNTTVLLTNSLYLTDSKDPSLFEFLSFNSDVEWSVLYSSKGVVIGTSHYKDGDGTPSLVQLHFPDIFQSTYQFDHYHPSGSSFTQADIDFSKGFNNSFYKVRFNVLHKNYDINIYNPKSAYYQPYTPFSDATIDILPPLQVNFYKFKLYNL